MRQERPQAAVDADKALDRQQIGAHRKDIDQHIGEDEDRHRKSEHGEDHHRAVDPRPGLPCRQHAHRDRRQHRDEQGRDRQGHGRLDPLRDQGRDRQVGEDRDAEIAVQQVPDPGRRTGYRAAGRARAPGGCAAMSAGVAVSPAMIAAGSPGLRCNRREHEQRHDRHDRDGREDSSDDVGEHPPIPSVLRDVPEKYHRGDDDPVKILAVGGRDHELAGRHIGDVVGVGFGLDVGGELFLRGEIGRLEPLADQAFELGVVRPAEPGLAVIGAQRPR